VKRELVVEYSVNWKVICKN